MRRAAQSNRRLGDKPVRPRSGRGLPALALPALLCPLFATADEDLQTKLANPVSELVTLPLQFTTTLKHGSLAKPQHTLNVQPVYPLSFGSWKLINRLIAPIVSTPALTPGEDRKNGLGNITYEGFFSPASTGGLVWAVGPILQLRTATDDRLGSGKWSAGPAAMVLTQTGPWSAGVLVTQLWSFAGDDLRPKVNQTQFQPILNYRLGPVHTLAYTGTVSANWAEDRSSQRWTVPIGITHSTLTKPAGFVPGNYIIGAPATTSSGRTTLAPGSCVSR
jgi:hypothetical protein